MKNEYKGYEFIGLHNEHITLPIIIFPHLFRSICIHCNGKLIYLVALEDETGAVSGGSSFTLGLAD